MLLVSVPSSSDPSSSDVDRVKSGIRGAPASTVSSCELNEMEYLQDYLEKLADMQREARKANKMQTPKGWKYLSMEELVLKEGKLLSNEPFTEEEEKVLLRLFKLAPGPYKTKECYYNALRLMWEDEVVKTKLVYTEGYASGHIMPVMHAWVTMNGKPIDVTWGPDMIGDGHNRVRSAKRLLERARHNLQENRYWGIGFPRKVIMKKVTDTGMTPSMIDDWEGGNPLIKTGIPKKWKV